MRLHDGPKMLTQYKYTRTNVPGYLHTNAWKFIGQQNVAQKKSAASRPTKERKRHLCVHESRVFITADWSKNLCLTRQ